MEKSMNKDIWVLVANSSKARIFFVETNQTLKELESLDHPESRNNGQNGNEESVERSEDGGMGKKYIGGGPVPKEQKLIHFAREVSQHLKSAYDKEKFKNLYLVASPAFLGVLRQSLPNNIEKCILEAVNKDMTAHSIVDIREHLPFTL